MRRIKQDTVTKTLMLCAGVLLLLAGLFLDSQTKELQKAILPTPQLSSHKPAVFSCECPDNKHTLQCQERRLAFDILMILYKSDPKVVQELFPTNHHLAANGDMHQMITELHKLHPTGEDPKGDTVLMFLEKWGLHYDIK